MSGFQQKHLKKIVTLPLSCMLKILDPFVDNANNDSKEAMYRNLTAKFFFFLPLRMVVFIDSTWVTSR